MAKRRARKAPEIGDYIEHREPYFDRVNRGKVILLLSAQFVYETKDGQTRFCLFKEDWNKIDEE
tara:strand:+ start:464 stop:655 length:192 start_codon:yes stop_codon:yes gene_type:complete